EPYAWRSLPNIDQRVLPDVAANILGRWKGRASFDVASRFNSQRRPTCAAGTSVARGQGIAQLRLMRAEVTHVVARPEDDVCLIAAALQTGKHWDHLKHLIRLEDERGVVRRASHGNGDLRLPGRDACRDQPLEQLWDVAQVGAPDLRVRGNLQPC